MFKFIYLPEPEIPVYSICKATYSKDILNRYLIAENYLFYMTDSGIHSGLFTSPHCERKTRYLSDQLIPKYLLEIIEVT